MKSEFKSSFAENIFKHKYALTQAQTWREKCRSIIESVCGVGTNGKQPPLLSKDDQHYLTEALVQFKWMPGGRYIYYAGRPARFWNNCYGLAGLEDTREEWANLTQRALSCLMTGGGIGVDYSVFRSKGRILAKTGGAACLTADTVVYKDRKKSGVNNTLTIDRLFYLQTYFPDKFAQIKIRSLDESSGVFYRNKLLGVVCNGLADVYEIVTESGYTIKATANHRFMDDGHSYKHLAEFSVGDLIAVNGVYMPVPVDETNRYKRYPCIECGSGVAKRGALCFSCRENRPCPQCGGKRNRKASVCFSCSSKNQQKSNALENTARQRKECLLARKDVCELCNTATGPFEVHHKDKNTHNNDSANLLNLCIMCHNAVHKVERKFGNPYSHRYVSFDPIKSITLVGKEVVFDLQMDGPNHNFVANGFVSHNSGPLPLAMIINEVGRNVCQGGSRRSAIYGSLNWQHDDIQEFLVAKNWFDQPIGKNGYTVADAKMDDFNYPAPLDMTNISVNYDDAWLERVQSGELPEVYQANVLQALKTGEPGFSFNFGAQEKYTIRNAPVCAETMVMTDEGYRPVSELIDKPSVVWTGKQWAKDVVFSCTGLHQPIVKVTMTNGRVIRCEPSHRFFVNNHGRVDKVPACFINPGDRLVVSSPSIDNEDDLNDVRVESVVEDGFADVYCADVGVEEHSFMAEGVILSNCTEFITDTDSDVCNLASLNLGGIETLDEFKRLANTVSKFLICGSVRSQLPYQKAYDVRSANRRIGLGLMGIHEWLLKRGYGYEVVSELHEWLSAYQYESESGANEHCDRFYLNRPKAYRALAPTGTIAILAGTTTGIEPLFATAYKRRYLVESNHWRYEYVVDSVAELLIKQYGFDPDTIDTAASLASNPEKRLKFQSDIQSYVDMGVSSCLAEGTALIATSAGMFRIEELANQADEGKFVDLQIHAESVNADGLQTTITHAYNNGVKPTVRVLCEYGYEIVSTPNHKIRVLNSDSTVSWKEAGSVLPNDLLIGRIGIGLWNTDWVNSSLSEMVGSNFDHDMKTNSKSVTFPTRMSRKLARLIGYLMSDGHVGENGIGLTNNDPYILDDFERLVSDLFCVSCNRLEDKRSAGLFSLNANSRNLSRFFVWLGLTGHDDNAVPLVIRRSGRLLIKEFIIGLTLDGHTSDRSIAPITSVSKVMVRDVQQLLLNYGIESSLCTHKEGSRIFPSGKYYSTKESYVLVLSGENATNFADWIGFAEPRKNEEAKRFSHGSRKVWGRQIPDLGFREQFRNTVLPKIRSKQFAEYFGSATCISHHGDWIGCELASKMMDVGFSFPDIFNDPSYVFRRVISIEDAGDRQTYDLSVPEGNSYLANGVIVHNTINLPSWGSELNNEDKVQDFSKLIAKYAHGLRGLTFYPDGSRGGQPITPVSYKEAIAQRGVVFEENSACKDGVCGI